MNQLIEIIGIKGILGAIGSIVALIAYFVSRATLIKKGENNIIKKQVEINYNNLLDITKKKEKIQSETQKLKDIIPNDNAFLDSLSTQGITTLSEAADAIVRGKVRKPSKSNKKT